MSDIAKRTALVEQRIGTEVLERVTPEQEKVMAEVIKLADHNPILHWKRNDPNHNKDFIVIDGNLEPVKEFVLKILFVAQLSFSALSADWSQIDGDSVVSVPVKVWRPEDGREVTAIGSSSIAEVRKSRTTREAHDAQARAQTRALKIAVEIYMGMPFINRIISEIFGGFQVGGDDDTGLGAEKDPKNVTPTPEPEDDGLGPQRAKAAEILVLARKLEKADVYARADVDSIRRDLIANKESMREIEGIGREVESDGETAGIGNANG